MKRTTDEMRYIIQTAFNANYGVQPPMDRIHIIIKRDDGTYAMFQVGRHKYRFESHLTGHGSVWCGDGTIEKLD